MSLTITRVGWEDLLAVPFLELGDDPAVGLDCWGQAREIARRAGLVFPDLAADRRSVAVAELDLSCFRYLGQRWSALGQVGDLLASDPSERGHASHVSTVVDVDRGIVLSTSRAGGAYCWPAHRMPCTYGVWRLR